MRDAVLLRGCRRHVAARLARRRRRSPGCENRKKSNRLTRKGGKSETQTPTTEPETANRELKTARERRPTAVSAVCSVDRVQCVRECESASGRGGRLHQYRSSGHACARASSLSWLRTAASAHDGLLTRARTAALRDVLTSVAPPPPPPASIASAGGAQGRAEGRGSAAAAVAAATERCFSGCRASLSPAAPASSGSCPPVCTLHQIVLVVVTIAAAPAGLARDRCVDPARAACLGCATAARRPLRLRRSRSRSLPDGRGPARSPDGRDLGPSRSPSSANAGALITPPVGCGCDCAPIAPSVPALAVAAAAPPIPALAAAAAAAAATISAVVVTRRVTPIPLALSAAPPPAGASETMVASGSAAMVGQPEAEEPRRRRRRRRQRQQGSSASATISWRRAASRLSLEVALCCQPPRAGLLLLQPQLPPSSSQASSGIPGSQSERDEQLQGST